MIAIPSCSRAALLVIAWALPVLTLARTHADAPAGVTAPPAALHEIGRASYYASRLSGRPMADGTRLDASGHYAASRTLPLGARVKVTNLANQKSTVVEIKDRGPHARGRILDVSLSAARDLDMQHQGVAQVRIEAVDPQDWSMP